MSPDFDALRRRARTEFLGKDGVVGIGESDNQPGHLVFLLNRTSRASQRRIQAWGRAYGVAVLFEVVGGFTPSRFSERTSRAR